MYLMERGLDVPVLPIRRAKRLRALSRSHGFSRGERQQPNREECVNLAPCPDKSGHPLHSKGDHGGFDVAMTRTYNRQSEKEKGRSFAKESARMIKKSGYSDGEIAEMLKL